MRQLPLYFLRLGLAGALFVLVVGCGSSVTKTSSAAPTPTPFVSATPSPTLSPTPTPTPTLSPTPSPTPTIDPGTLPQTMVRPSIDANFLARLQGYWTHVLAGNAGLASEFFFPRTAYLQLKTLSYAGADFDGRLYHDYRNDVIADHRLVTAGATKASVIKVLGVDVPEASVHWVPPGVEANSIGYYQVSYPRIRYSVDGQQRSYAISSMISWRGEWYVVHLGPNWRPGEGGWVCTPDPSTVPSIAAACLRG